MARYKLAQYAHYQNAVKQMRAKKLEMSLPGGMGEI